MATGSNVINSLLNATAPGTGAPSNAVVSFGGTQVLQACPNIYLEVILSDPTNTGSPATFEVQIHGGIQSTNNAIGSPITVPGLYTITADSPITFWRADLISLSGGTAPAITVNGVAGE